MINKRQIAAAAGLVLVAGTGSFVGGSAVASAEAPAARTTVGGLQITPSTNLKNAQVVKLKVSGFGSFSGKVTIVQCTPGVIADGTHPSKYCDTRPSSEAKLTMKKGKASGTFKVRVGSAFKAGSKANKCAKGGKCLVVATSSAKNPKYAAFSQVSFKK